jgi:ABC-type branched-subunit amino acid transport system ATPase component
MRRLGLVYVPREHALSQDLTIRDNLRLGLLSHRDFGLALENEIGVPYEHVPVTFNVPDAQCKEPWCT